MAKKDLYNILGVEKDATKADIRKAYRKLCLTLHPDKQVGKPEKEQKEAEEKFKEVGEAYEILSDDEKRKQYDRFGIIGNDRGNSGIDEVMKRWAEAAGFSSQRSTLRGQDKLLKINITMKELYTGGSKTVKFTRMHRCSKCNGTGNKNGKIEYCRYCNGTGMINQQIQQGGMFTVYSTTCRHCNGTGQIITDPCPECQGTGLIAKEDTIRISIPTIDRFPSPDRRFGVQFGGHESKDKNGKNGDLIYVLNLTQEEGDLFELDRANIANLITHVDVPVIDCLLGSDVKIQTYDGQWLKFHIHSCTKTNEMYGIPGKGLPLSNGSKGDICVIINPIMPTSITEKERKILTGLKDSKSFKQNNKK